MTPMNLETISLVPERVRTVFIEGSITGKLPEDLRERAKERATEIVNYYVGQEVNALSVLAYAAEQGRFDEFAERLERHYQESLQYVHPSARRIAGVPGVLRAEEFFLGCYQSMGVSPQDQQMTLALNRG